MSSPDARARDYLELDPPTERQVDGPYVVLPPFPDAEIDDEPGRVAEIIPPPGKRGPRTIYTAELGQMVADGLAEGQTLRQVCRQIGGVDERTVRRWAMNPQHPFAKLYEAGRRIGYHQMADELVEIADDGTNDWMERETLSGTVIRVIDTEVVMRSRLRVSTRQWLLSKALPKVYGRAAEETEKADEQQPFLTMLKLVSSGQAAKLITQSGPADT